MAKLAEMSKLEPQSVEKLFAAFCKQLSTRLPRKESVEQKGIGYWEAVVEKEFVAVVPDKEYLLPPRVRLIISSIPNNKTITPEAIIIEAISKQTGITLENTKIWWENIPKLLLMELSKGIEVSWKDFGTFNATENGFRFSPKGQLQASLNYAFVDFPIVEVNQDKKVDDTEYKNFQSIQQALDLSSVISPDIDIEKESRPESFQDNEVSVSESTNNDEEVPSNNEEIQTEVSREINEQTEDDTPLSEETDVIEKTAEEEQSENDSENNSEEEQIREEQPEYQSNTDKQTSLDDTKSKEISDSNDSSDDTSSSYIVEDEDKKAPWKALIIGICIITIMLTAIFMLLKPGAKADKNVKGSPIELPKKKPDPQTNLDTVTAKDTAIIVEPTEDVKPEPQTKPQTKPEVGKEEKSETLPSGDKWITIQPGDHLRNIALREYGDKSFWVYIYEANKSRLSDPDNVQAGTKILIPKRVSKYVERMKVSQ